MKVQQPVFKHTCSLYFLIVLVVLLETNPVFGQEITGHWQGTFNTDMDFRGKRRSFFLDMHLIQNGNKVKGIFSTAGFESPTHPNVSYEISGIASQNQKIPSRLMVGKILYSVLPGRVAEVFWQFDDIRHFKNDTTEILYGKWLPNGSPSPRSDGAGGTFWVKKIRDTATQKNKPVLFYTDRKNVIADSFSCSPGNLEIELFDNAEIDGDSVSVYINDSLVVEKKRLTARAYKITIPLGSNSVYKVSLFAENLGLIPPNTALMRLRATGKSKDILLKADYQNNAVVIIDTNE